MFGTFFACPKWVPAVPVCREADITPKWPESTPAKAGQALIMLLYYCSAGIFALISFIHSSNLYVLISKHGNFFCFRIY